MHKILLGIIASAVVVAMLPAFGTPAALANPSPGVPGGGAIPPGQNPVRTGGAHPGSPTFSCDETTLTNTPGNSGSSGGAHTAGHSYNPGSPGQPGGSQYDVSCYQQSVH